MASLQTLPAELIISIFTAGDVYAAVRLSAVNRRLRTIWKEHACSIVEEILSTQIPAYEYAVKVANTEMEFSDDDAISLDLKAASQIGKWLSNLLRNAEMASEMCEAWSKHYEWLAVKYPQLPQPEFNHQNPKERSYYVLRSLAFCYNHPELFPDIASKLENESVSVLEAHDDLFNFIINDAPWELLEKHGIAKPEDQWTPEDELGGNPCVDAWEDFGPTRTPSNMIWCKVRGRRPEFPKWYHKRLDELRQDQ